MDTNITQLKQEQIVGDTVIFDDVQPKTVSEAVYDDGVPMNEVISRLWNSINNKLSRVVNSVNGRTGVVVLNKSDVGLSEVDNISFGDIKEWVIELLGKNGNHLQLVESMTIIDELCASGDKTLNGAPFYAEKGYGTDNKPYIGYIYWDEETEELNHDQKAIKIPAQGDMSIIYNEQVGSKDYSNGMIGVNIAPGEEALKVLDTGDKATSGLMIDKSKLGAQLVEIDGVYGDGTVTDTNALLYFNAATTPATAKTVYIYIDGSKIVNNNMKMKRTDLTEGSLILCHFRDYRTYSESSGTSSDLPTGMVPALVSRTSALGRVRVAPSEKAGIDYYTIDFFSLKTNPGWGMQNMQDHRIDITNNALIPMVASSPYFYQATTDAVVNVSGLNIFASRARDWNVLEPEEQSRSFMDAASLVVDPVGVKSSMHGGIGIVTDYSLSLYPSQWFGNHSSVDPTYGTYTDSQGKVRNYGSYMIANWSNRAPEGYQNITKDFEQGTSNTMCPVGVNLDKMVLHAALEPESKFKGTRFKVSNISGLRICKPSWHMAPGFDELHETEGRPKSWFGGHNGDPIFDTDTFTDDYKVGASGGLSVNVGKFLEIEPGAIKEKADEYYDGGKVNVRIGKGLEEEPVTYSESGLTQITGNRIQIKVDPTRDDLGFDENGNLYIKNAVGKLKGLQFKDTSSNSILYNPTSAELSEEDIITINLGPGLIIEN